MNGENKPPFSAIEIAGFEYIQGYHPGNFALMPAKYQGVAVSVLAIKDEQQLRPIAIMLNDSMIKKIDMGELGKFVETPDDADNNDSLGE